MWWLSGLRCNPDNHPTPQSLPWFNSLLCWPWWRWTGQAWEVGIITTWSVSIFHTCNRRVTEDTVEEEAKADGSIRKTQQATHILLSVQRCLSHRMEGFFFFKTWGRYTVTSLHECSIAHKTRLKHCYCITVLFLSFVDVLRFIAY